MKRPPKDPGLELIDNYARAIVQAHVDRFAGYTADVIARERAAVETLAANIAAQLRLEYLSNRSRSSQP
jgi:hypothetical protein